MLCCLKTDEQIRLFPMIPATRLDLVQKNVYKQPLLDPVLAHKSMARGH